MNSPHSRNSNRISIYSIYNNEPPPYDIAAKDKLPEYTARDDPPMYEEVEKTQVTKDVDGCDNPTYDSTHDSVI